MCVDDVVKLGGGALERVQIYILAERLKIDFFKHYQVEKAVWYKLFCESCEQLDITHPSVHMEICDSRLITSFVLSNGPPVGKGSQVGLYVYSCLCVRRDLESIFYHCRVSVKLMQASHMKVPPDHYK